MTAILQMLRGGMRNGADAKVVKDLAQETRCTIEALQETKLSVINETDITEILAVRFSKQFAYLPAQGTRGGALIAVDEDYYNICRSEVRDHIVSVCVTSTQCTESWWLTVVYGPQGDRGKNRVSKGTERTQISSGR